MSKEKRDVILAFVLSALAGTLLHFLYSAFPSPLTALLSPVAESIWEHVKLIYFPGLAAAAFLSRRHGKLGERLLALLLACAVMLALGYLYHILLGGESFPVDIAIYLASTALASWLPYPLEKRVQGRWSELFLLLVIALGGAVCLFTFLPPESALYADLSGAHTWAVIPY